MLNTGVVQKVMMSAACNILTADDNRPAAMMMMSSPVQRKKGASATLRVERSSPHTSAMDTSSPASEPIRPDCRSTPCPE